MDVAASGSISQHAQNRRAGPIDTEKTEPPQPTRGRIFLEGVRDAFKLPAYMVSASMAGYGSLVRSADLDVWLGMTSTAGIWGLPGQVAFVEFVVLGAPIFSIVLAVAMANMRFLPMSIAMMPLFRPSASAWRWRYLLVQLMSINTWVGLSRRAPTLHPDLRMPYYMGYSLLCLLTGLAGTAVGYYLAGTMPYYVAATLVLINPLYFAFIFAASRSRSCLIALSIGTVLGPLFHLVSPEWGLPFCGLIAGTVGFKLDRYLRGRAP